MLIKDLIKNKRLEKGLTMKELSEQVGVSEATISRWESGEISNMKHKGIISLSNILGIEPNILMGWDQELESVPGIISLNKAKRIPIMGTIACGNPIWAEENYDGFFIADSSIKADFIVKAKGDSMIDADIHDGDLVFLKQTSDVDNGKIAAVMIDNEATLKKILKAEDIVVLQPCNNKYDPIILTSDSNAMILGEMVGVYKPY